MTEHGLPRTSKHRHPRRVKMLGLTLIGITLLGLTAPLIIARTGLRDWLINAIVASPNLSLSSAQASLGWTTPASIDGLTLEGAEKRFQLEIARVEAERAWPQLLASTPKLGTIIVDSPHVRLDLPINSAANVDVPIAPIFDAQIRDAALTVHHQDLDDPILDVRGIDVDLHVRRPGDTTVLSVDPVSLFSQEPITPKHCSELLQLINPSLQQATNVDGRRRDHDWRLWFP